MSSKHRDPSRSHSSESRAPRAILLSAYDPHARDAGADVHDVRARSLDELAELVVGLGYEIAARVVQRRAPSSVSYLGEGKLAEVAALTGGAGEIVSALEGDERARDPDAPIVVVDDAISPAVERALSRALGTSVVDRSGVILRVFEARARTREAMHEVELARLAYELPRLRDDHTRGDREGGGGRASRGHSNVELAKQRMRERMALLRRALDGLAEQDERRREARGSERTVALVGYTNAGKSSLMRALTGSEVLVEDKLFATLGTTVRQLSPPRTPRVLVADTVGFLHRLPHELFASFRSTLSEARGAWLIVVVADADSPALETELHVTDETLAEIGARDTPRLLVLNKVDLLDDEARASLRARYPRALLLSALDARDTAELRARIEETLDEGLDERVFHVPYAQQKAIAELRARAQIVDEKFDEDVTLTVRGWARDLDAFAARLATPGAD